MIQVWRNYFTDMGRAYPMMALLTAKLNDKADDTKPIDLLPSAIKSELVETKYACGVDGLTPRSIVLWTNNGGQFRLSYPRPFSQTLFDYLTVKPEVLAFELVGERIKYSRLKRLLDNVRS